MARIVSAVTGISLVFGVSSASFAQDFGAAVEIVLMRQKEITDLSPDQQREMISCVNGVLAEVPEPTKAEVAGAGDPDEMEKRFGEMVLANQAELKQKITATCGDIVMEQ